MLMKTFLSEDVVLTNGCANMMQCHFVRINQL